MKKRILSIAVSLCTVLSLFPVSAYAEEMNTPEPLYSNVGESVSGNESISGNQSVSGNSAQNTTSQENNTLTAVEKVQAMLNALPTTESLEAADDVTVNAAYEAARNVYDAIEELEAEEIALLTGMEKLSALMDWFNGQVSMLEGQTPVSYVDENGNEGTCTNYTVFTSDISELTGDATAENAKWYVVSSDVTISNTVTVTGNVHLILFDDKKLTVEPNDTQKCISINNGASLTIYGQVGQSGKLITNGKNNINDGNIEIITGGNLTINGGNVKSESKLGSGIRAYGKLTVNRGNVTAIGDFYGLYIEDKATVNGGVLNATSKNGSGISVFTQSGAQTPAELTINAGKVTVSGNSAVLLKAKDVNGHVAQLILPTNYYWRTSDAEGAKYRTQASSYTDSDLNGEYFELTTTPPADNMLDRVGYLDWDNTNMCLNTSLTYRESATKVTSDMSTLGESGKETWYYVDEETNISNTVTVTGNVHLILCDDKKLTVEPNDTQNGITINDGASLTIYGQVGQSGKLITKGNKSDNGGNIEINNGGNLTINGGNVKSESYKGSSIKALGTLTVNSGNVTATELIDLQYGLYIGNSATVNGGVLNVTKKDGYGIGVFTQSGAKTSANLTINAGKVIVSANTAVTLNAIDEDIDPVATLTPPTNYYWRTSDAEGAKYRTQASSYRDRDLNGKYFELTTSKPASNIEPYVTNAIATVTYGDTPKNSDINALPEVDGTFSWKDVTSYGDASATSKQFTATFTPSDNCYVAVDVEVSVTVKKADQVVPTITNTAETVDGKADGKIISVTNAMEYCKAGDTNYTAITGTEITGLAGGKYYVRYKADDNHNASADTEVTIDTGRKLTVTVPTTQVGYTLTVNKNKLIWNDSMELTFALAEGYAKLNTFAVNINGNPIALDANGKCTVTNVQSDITVTVAGVADITAKKPPVITDGRGQNITAGESKELSFRSNANYSDFIRVDLDGNTVDEKNYTKREGSTIITLNAEYVASLPKGEHTISIVSTTGTASASFTISEASSSNESASTPANEPVVTKAAEKTSPATGDGNNIALWITMLLLGGLCMGAGIYGKKSNSKTP